jgi:hypothetical protein
MWHSVVLWLYNIATNVVSVKTNLYLDKSVYVSKWATCFDLGKLIFKLITITKTNIGEDNVHYFPQCVFLELWACDWTILGRKSPFFLDI